MAETNNQDPVQDPNQSPGTGQIPNQNQGKSLGTGPGQGQQPGKPQDQDQPTDKPQDQDQPSDKPQDQGKKKGSKKKGGKKDNSSQPVVILADKDQQLIAIYAALRKQRTQYGSAHMPDFTVQTSLGDVKFSEFLQNGPTGAYNALSSEARDAYQKAAIDAAEKLRYIDDELFRTGMDGQIAVVQEILRRITGDDTIILANMQLQKDYYFPGQYHSCIPDVYCESTDGRIFIIELQKQKKSEDAARASFLAHASSFASLKANRPYNEMKDVYVIFLTDIDVYGTGEFIHWIRDPETFPKFRGDPQPRHTPQTHKIFVNCKYGYTAINRQRELASLESNATPESDKAQKRKLQRKIRHLQKLRDDQIAQMGEETSRYGLTTAAWESALLLAHDLCTANPDDIDQPALANIMRVVKKPNAEGVSEMSSIVWEVVQKTNAQVRKVTREETRKVTREETQREDAANLLALGVDISIIAQALGLSEEEIRTQVAHSTT